MTTDRINFEEGFKPEPIPNVVYHYTSIDTLMNILKSGEVWSTSIDYLNDVSEQEYVLKRIRERVPSFQNHEDLPSPDVFSKCLSSDLKMEKFESHPFVISFCGQADSLHHWRSYCPDGNGVSIGFKTECLKRAFIKTLPSMKETDIAGSKSTTFLTKVKYIEEQDTAAIDNMIEFALIATIFLSKLPDFVSKNENSKAELFDFLIDRLACSCKHPSFKSEDEYRLIVTQPFVDYQYLEFKTRKSTLRPHIPVKVPRRVTGHENDEPLMAWTSALAGRWDFIDRIIIGPTVSRDLSLQAIEALVRREGLNVQVLSSDVPYRDW